MRSFSKSDSSQSGSTAFLKYRFNDRRDEGSGLLRNFKKESYHWTAFDPVARVAPDALVADGSNFFAYCGYDPVNCIDPMGGWKVPVSDPLSQAPMELLLASGGPAWHSRLP